MCARPAAGYPDGQFTINVGEALQRRARRQAAGRSSALVEDLAQGTDGFLDSQGSQCPAAEIMNAGPGMPMASWAREDHAGGTTSIPSSYQIRLKDGRFVEGIRFIGSGDAGRAMNRRPTRITFYSSGLGIT